MYMSAFLGPVPTREFVYMLATVCVCVCVCVCVFVLGFLGPRCMACGIIPNQGLNPGHGKESPES